MPTNAPPTREASSVAVLPSGCLNLARSASDGDAELGSPYATSTHVTRAALRRVAQIPLCPADLAFIP